MLRAALIANESGTAELLGRVIWQSAQITLDHTVCPAPTHYQMARILNTLSLDVVFLDVSDGETARKLAAEIARKAPATAVVGFCVGGGREVAVQHHLPWPLTPGGVLEAVRSSIYAAAPNPIGNVSCFIPAKPGDGASTVTLNSACQMARHFVKNVLAIDADLRSGTLADRLSAAPSQSIGQSLALADSAASLIWARHVHRANGVDWMLSSRDRTNSGPSWHDFRHLLAFAATKYDQVLIDVPDFLDDATSEIVRLSRFVYVVTTQEVLSLRLARHRIDELESLGVPKSRIRVVINRWHSDQVLPTDIRTMLGCELAAVVPNEYREVNDSILAGTSVPDGTRVGQASKALAGVIAGFARPVCDPGKSQSRFSILSWPRRWAALSEG